MNTPSSDTTSTTISTTRRLSTRDMVLAGMFAAVLAIISQISIPMPTGVPITIQVFGVALVGVILGWRLGLFATVSYILLGAAGLPIFANFRGGFGMLVDFTGGYIWSWPLMVVLCGIKPQTHSRVVNTSLIFLFSLLGLALNEIAGGLQWAALSGDMSVWGVFAYAMVAFIPKDVALTVFAVIVGMQMRKMLARSIPLIN